MRKTTIFLIVLLMLTSLISCSKVEFTSTNGNHIEENDTSSEERVVEETSVGNEELKVIYDYPNSHFATSFSDSIIVGYMVELRALGIFDKYIVLDCKDKTASLDSKYLPLLEQGLVFFSEEYIYSYNEIEGTFTRSDYDDTETSEISLPSGWSLRTGKIISDSSNNIYAVVEGIEESNRNLSQLLKLDFTNSNYEILLSSKTSEDTFSLVGIHNNDIVIAIYPYYDDDGMPTSLTSINKKRVLKSFSIVDKSVSTLESNYYLMASPDLQFTDLYTNTYYYFGNTKRTVVRKIDYTSNEDVAIEFTAPEDIEFLYLLPIASTKDYFILSVGSIAIRNSYLSKYAMVTREDYLSGNLNLIPFSYDEVLEEIDSLG